MKTRWAKILTTIFLTGFLFTNADAIQTDIAGPAGSGAFGTTVTILPNGNFVITDPFYDEGGVNDIGAVYLYNGANLTLISTLKGSTLNDQVGGDGVTVLANGNFVVVSSFWDNPSPAIGAVGAVTWCSAATGCNGLVSVNNSLIGGTVNDRVGNNGVTALPNGNYVVNSTAWDNTMPPVINAGAVTLGNGMSGTVGLVSAGNSLVGGIFADQVGNDLSRGVTVLTNGNYVVSSSFWDNPSPSRADVGAITLCGATSGCVGLVTTNNSLVGGTANDEIGINGVTALTNGNYVVRSQNWDNPSPLTVNVGAVTWGNGMSGTVGVVTSGNSLIGGTLNDSVGQDGVTALTNGNYVVSASLWNNPSPAAVDAGAATLCNGTTGTVGLVSAGNSLIGGTLSDSVGREGAVALTNGNYVVRSGVWNNPSPATTDVGAVTFGNGTTGTVGLVSANNSLIGGTTSDTVGFEGGVLALTNGNYAVQSDRWNNPSGSSTDARAVTFGNGTVGTVGPISSANSVLGTVASGINDFPGFSYDATRNRLFVRRTVSNIVSILSFAPSNRAPFDFDGDGKSDISIFRPAPAEWWYLRSSDGGNAAAQFGQTTDRITPGDFTGDGKTDIAFWRPSNGFWFILRSENGTFFSFPFGTINDIPAPADYDGDGKTDAAVFRPSLAIWFILRSSDGGTTFQQFGVSKGN